MLARKRARISSVTLIDLAHTHSAHENKGQTAHANSHTATLTDFGACMHTHPPILCR